ncbi:hypothetical protein C806_03069 [Lachnospiraceae bacterium 3-1]|nr:hypothetical protein C806_03069 [Lachnospiraceae bacterium 3-1]
MDYESNKSYIEMRSAGMSVTSLIMGIFGLIMSCCIYPAMIFGSLAIIFALLSRGGEMHTNSYAKAGLILGIIAIICGILFFIYSILTLLIQFGGIEGYLQSIEELIQDMEYPNSSNPYDFYDML